MTRQTVDGTYLGDAYITVEAGDTKISTLAGLAVGTIGGYFGNAHVEINGGIINYFVTASDVTQSTAQTGAPRGTITVNVTANFDVSKSFTADAGVSHNGFVLSDAIKTYTAHVRDNYGTYILNVDAQVYKEIADAGMIIEDSIHTLNITGEILEGDFDMDGALTNSDVTLLVRYLAG